jgi:hypothetical protein
MPSVREKIVEIARKNADADAEQLLKLLPEDDEAYGDMVAELMRMGFEAALRLARMETVRNVRGTSGPRMIVPPDWKPHENEGRGIAARMRVVEPAYSWELPNGAQLGMASVGDLEDAIAAHSVKAHAHIGWVKFYSAVKARVVKEKAHTVSDVLSAPQLLQLKDASGVKDEI